MSAQPQQRRSEEEYLARERVSADKHEYHAGVIVAMADASPTHNIIAGNIFASLHLQLRRRACVVFPSDMRLLVERARVYTYPDISVVCGEPAFRDEHQDSLVNPTVLIEVLSPSTETYDRGKKSQYYRLIPSLQEYILVAQDARHIEQYIRQNAFQWLFSESTAPDACIHLPSIDCTLAVEDVYEKVIFRTADT